MDTEKRGRGRPPKGDRAMTGAERNLRWAQKRFGGGAPAEPDREGADLDRAFFETWEKATPADMAGGLFLEKGADYCQELIKNVLNLLAWNQEGRPRPWPWVVVRMPHSQLSYGLQKLEPEGSQEPQETSQQTAPVPADAPPSPAPRKPRTKPIAFEVSENVWAYRREGQRLIFEEATIIRETKTRLTVLFQGHKFLTDKALQIIGDKDAFLERSDRWRFTRNRQWKEESHRNVMQFRRELAREDGIGDDETALELLDLRPGFSRADVDRAFREKAQKYHPDKEAGDAVVMRSLIKAKETLLDQLE